MRQSAVWRFNSNRETSLFFSFRLPIFEEPATPGLAPNVRTGLDAELRQDARDVMIHRLGRKKQPLGDFVVAQPFTDELRNFNFTTGQSC